MDCLFREATEANLYDSPVDNLEAYLKAKLAAQGAAPRVGQRFDDVPALCPQCFERLQALWCALAVPSCGTFDVLVQRGILPALGQVRLLWFSAPSPPHSLSQLALRYRVRPALRVVRHVPKYAAPAVVGPLDRRPSRRTGPAAAPRAPRRWRAPWRRPCTCRAPGCPAPTCARLCWTRAAATASECARPAVWRALVYFRRG